MIETMGKPDKDLNESMKHICDVVQKRIDEAYQRGLNDGKEYGLDESDMREAVSYQRGLDDAWEAARKIVKMADPPYWGVFNEYKDDLFVKITASEAIEKLKAYEEKQKADDEIKAGDVVKPCINSVKAPFVVTKVSDEHVWGVDANGSWNFWRIDEVTKTNKHCDIDKILEEMKE